MLSLSEDSSEVLSEDSSDQVLWEEKAPQVLSEESCRSAPPFVSTY